MAIKTFYEFGSERPVSLSASAVATVYPEPDNEELVTIELVNGSKYTVKADINSVRNGLRPADHWPILSERAADFGSLAAAGMRRAFLALRLLAFPPS